MRGINLKIHPFNIDCLPFLMQTSRCFLQFKFVNLSISVMFHEFFEYISCRVEGLSFNLCKILLKFDFTFNNLRFLYYDVCDLDDFFPCVPNLNEFRLSSNITDYGISTLQKTMKHLKSFSITCDVAYDRKAYKRFYVRQSYEVCPSDCILSFPAVLSFISERAETLKELKFVKITSHALEAISKIDNLSLNKIELYDSFNCSAGLPEFFRNQQCLNVLILQDVQLNDDIITALCTFLKDVSELDIKYCEINSDSLNKILHLKKLKKFKMGQSSMKNFEGKFEEAFTNIKCLPIEVLDLSLTFLSPDLLLAHCPYLVYLDLGYTKASDETVHLISENLIKLEYLSLRNTKVSDYGITGLQCFENNENEKNVSFKPLSNLKLLRELMLGNCFKITDTGVINAICFKYLEYLDLQNLSFTENTIDFLFLQNPNIKKLLI